MPVITGGDVDRAIGYVVKEREARRDSVEDPDKRYEKVLEMNKILDVLRVAENVVKSVHGD